MEIHVICCNDSLEYAIVEDESKALKKLEELKQDYYERSKWFWREDYDTYKRVCYWHIRTLQGEL